MPRLITSEPPCSLSGKPYSEYRDWLESNFFYHLCSYCLIQHFSSLHIDHFEPRKYAPSRVNDPTNLLLACPKCNSGKSDYHPNHSGRRRLRNTTPCHRVIDIRRDDFSQIFSLRKCGELTPQPGEYYEIAIFNISYLLRLNTPERKRIRAKKLDLLSTTEEYLLKIPDMHIENTNVLSILVDECARTFLFYQAFDLKISEKLLELIENSRAEQLKA